MIKRLLVFVIGISATTAFCVIPFSCGDKNRTSNPTPKAEQTRRFAIVIDTSGKKIPTIALMAVGKSIKTDSLTKKDEIVYDTVFGVERIIQIKDSLGKKINRTVWAMIRKDSVTWVCDIPLDTLLKK